MNKKFEYKVIQKSLSDSEYESEKILNKYGAEGWELICIDQYKYVFKHEINEIILKS